MTVVLVLEQRFERTPDGIVWAPGSVVTSLWPRYLNVFDRLRVVARIRDVPVGPAEWKPAQAERVSFAAVRDYGGALQYLRRAPHVWATLRRAVGRSDAVILRVPSQLSSDLATVLRRRRHPFGVEVVGDPFDVFAPGVIEHPLREFLRWWFARRQRELCARAIAAQYVTEEALQRRYPCPSYSTGVSDVELSADDVCAEPRPCDALKRAFTLVTVTSLARLYKGPDVLIAAVAECVHSGLDVRLLIVGDGRHRPELENQAFQLGLADRVVFTGHLASRIAVRRVLDDADLFVLPSRTEGLPRAMVEAMARALPCIGSAVGGIPELLAEEDMVPAGDVRALATKLREVVTDPLRLQRMSVRNLQKAREVSAEEMQHRRRAFLERIRGATAALASTSHRHS